jgi:phosphatidylserine decarboxylase
MENSVMVGIVLILLTALPLAWKWQLGMLRVGSTVLLLGILAGVLVVFAGRSVALTEGLRAVLTWLLGMGMAFGILLYRFYRDPERTPPDRPNVIVSPADGVVIYVRKSADGVLPVSTKKGRNYKLVELTKTPMCSGDAVVVGISMSFLDVHVNRVPCSGRVAFREHFHGLFGSLCAPEMVFENERATTVIEKDGFEVAIVQIASRLVRQIAVFVREGQEVALGERMGVIRLGSQVDLVLTARENLKIVVKPGDRVTAGESIVAELG